MDRPIGPGVGMRPDSLSTPKTNRFTIVPIQEDEPNDIGYHFEIDALAPVVVGVQPHAEMWHRPLAYRMRDQILHWQETFCDDPVLIPVVISDVWYVNHRAYESRPVISIGEPRVNALTAFLTDKLPVAAAEEEQYLVQIQDSFQVARACLWGNQPNRTQDAVDVFLDRFLDDWMRRVIEVQEATTICD